MKTTIVWCKMLCGMSGHSKWATIHRQKESKDAKRGAAFTKLANAITVSVREGGGVGDVESNFKLRLAVEKAREANMPKENIARAIERGVGGGEGVSFETVMYEGFGPGGVAILIEVTTDNRLRSQGEIRNLLDKSGGAMGGLGSVGYLFERKGYLHVDQVMDADSAMLELIDLGALDVDPVSGGLEVYCNLSDLFELKKKIGEHGMRVVTAEVIMDPITTIVVEGEMAEKVHSVLERLSDLDDVQKVYTNAEFPTQQGGEIL